MMMIYMTGVDIKEQNAVTSLQMKIIKKALLRDVRKA